MRKFLICFTFICLFSFSNAFFIESQENTPVATGTGCFDLYCKLDLKDVVSYKAFRLALVGYQTIENRKKDILTVIDFSKPSTQKRMCVIDMRNEVVLYSSHVSHGRNSGENYATSFSNKKGSFKSSLGFYMTENSYNGSNGYSLILNGLEKGINDKAKERAIVIHGADYCNPNNIAESGRLGRSLGCPALPRVLTKPVINTIKDGSLLYIYADDNTYFSQSKMLPTSPLVSGRTISSVS